MNTKKINTSAYHPATDGMVERFNGTLAESISMFDLVGFSGADSLMFADLASSLGHGLQKDPRFSDVSCLTCARTLARTHASVLKLFAGIVERESLKAAKRQTNARSPTGDTPSAKRPNTSSGDGQESTSKSRHSLSLGGQT